jgi:alginate O-acetyltransferase complex protein AlgI
MLFNSTEFLFLFLPLSLLLFYGMARWSTQAALGSLTLASLFFYAWWDWHFLPVLLVSMVFNFLLGKLLQRETAYRGYLLAAAVTVNLSALFFYKYLDFAIASLNASLGTSLPTQSLALPLGISFFTFTQLAYLVDVYYRKAKESRVVDYVLFVT